VNVDFAALGDLLAHESDALFNVLETRGREVDRWNSQLLDVRVFVCANWSGIFLARVNDCGHSFRPQRGNIEPKWKGSENDVIVNVVPPVPYAQDASQKNVPAEGWNEYQSRNEPTHGRGLSLFVSFFKSPLPAD
jgi:hypothetical protein